MFIIVLMFIDIAQFFVMQILLVALSLLVSPISLDRNFHIVNVHVTHKRLLAK
jgi:hypothetical protein